MEKYKDEINADIESQIEFFIDKFVKNGWKQEDSAYIIKDFGFSFFNLNDHDVTKVGIVIYPELINYDNKYHIWLK